MKHPVIAALLLGALDCASVFGLGYKVNVDAPKDWDKDLGEIAVVVTQAHESLNAEDLRTQITNRLLEMQRKLPFKVTHGRKVEEATGWDWGGGDPQKLRETVFEKTNATAIFEVQAPFATGAHFGARGAEVRVRARIVLRDGDNAMSGDCSAQAFNTVSSPENIARHCALRILGEALDENLD